MIGRAILKMSLLESNCVITEPLLRCPGIGMED
jgi:hypothetical protein